MEKKTFNNALNKVAAKASTATALAAASALSVLLVPSFAFAASETMNNILKNLGGVIITVIAIVGVVFTVKAVLDYMKGGDGSIGKIVTTVLVVLLFIGLVLVLTNADQIGDMFRPIADTGVQSASNLATDILGSQTKH